MRTRAAVLATMFILIYSPILSTAEEHQEGIIITEIYVSPNNADYGGVDWNGDGEIGRYSNQFIEIYNSGESPIDIGGWWIDDAVSDGSPSCSIGFGTIVQPGDYVTFFRAQTGIELDYFEGDVVTISDSSRSVVDSVGYFGPETWMDSDYDIGNSSYGIPFGLNTDGTWSEVESGPTPGGPNDEPWQGTNHLQGSCYTVRDDTHSGSYVLQGRIVTMESQDSILEQGNILVSDGLITALWESAESPPEEAIGAPVIQTSGTIYPGFIDPHNHAKYNLIPLWDHGTDGWDNRYQWQSYSGYSDAKDIGCSISDPMAMRFAELRAIAGGNTAIQGSANTNTDSFDSILTRNIELYNFNKDSIHTKVTELESDYLGNHIKTGNSSGSLDAWFLHLAEGTDESSRAEFDILVQNDLLVGEIVIVHGTALTQQEFSLLGEAGGSLAWSPTSNLLLYGQTTNIASAKEEGVNIMIGPDWGPSGSKSSMHELKTADWWNRNVLENTFTDFELVQAISTNIVDAIGWSDYTGRIKVGLAADLVVLDTFEQDPYRNVILATDPDVRLVTVGGLPVYGDVDIMNAMTDEPEIIHGTGFSKAVDITYEGVPDANRNYSEMMEYLGECNEGKPVPLEHLFTMGDERYFDVLNRSITFQMGRTIDLWGDYYDITLDSNGHRVGGSVSMAGPLDSNFSNQIVPTEDPDQDFSLPQIFQTYGPIGATVAHPVQITDGIHLEECRSNASILGVEGVPEVPEGRQLVCGSIYIGTTQGSGCLETSSGDFCQFEISSAIAIPSHFCSENIPPEGVVCRDAWAFHVSLPEPTEPPAAESLSEDNGISGPLYWIAVVGLLGLIISSATVVITSWNKRT